MKNTRSAFTLVELLVVIAIIGILMGLLIPAVGAARETARRNECSVKMKNLSLATIQYADSKGQLPGFINKFGVFAGGNDPSETVMEPVPRHVKVGTWAVALLPWLDAQPTYEHWTEDRYPIIDMPGGEYEPINDAHYSGVGFHPLSAPTLAVMQCGSNPVSEGDAAANSYIANNGMCNTSYGTASPTSTIGYEASQARANGAFNNQYNVASLDAAGNGVIAGQGPKVRLDDFKDGTSTTILFSENVQAYPWHRSGFLNATDFVTTGNDVALDAMTMAAVEAARYTNGMVWHYADPDNTNVGIAWSNGAPLGVHPFFRINGGALASQTDIFTKVIRLNDVTDARALARPSSAHNDGVNAAFADGGTRYIQDSINYRVYQALMTPRGKSSDVPWTEFIMNDDDF